jgi:hypothetical protein
LLYTHMWVHACVCIVCQLTTKTWSTFPIFFVSLWYLLHISDFLKYIKIFLFLFHDCSWNLYWTFCRMWLENILDRGDTVTGEYCGTLERLQQAIHHSRSGFLCYDIIILPFYTVTPGSTLPTRLATGHGAIAGRLTAPSLQTQ